MITPLSLVGLLGWGQGAASDNHCWTTPIIIINYHQYHQQQTTTKWAVEQDLQFGISKITKSTQATDDHSWTTPPPTSTVNITGVRQPLLADVALSPGDSKLHFLEDMLLLSHLPNWWLSRLCVLAVSRDFQIHKIHLCRPALALPNLRVCRLALCDYKQF